MTVGLRLGEKRSGHFCLVDHYTFDAFGGFLKLEIFSWAGIVVIPPLRRQEQDRKFEASLRYRYVSGSALP